jgi:hypothetical protein
VKAVSQLVSTEAIGLFVVFSQGKPPLAILIRPQSLQTALGSRSSNGNATRYCLTMSVFPVRCTGRDAYAAFLKESRMNCTRSRQAAQEIRVSVPDRLIPSLVVSALDVLLGWPENSPSFP